MFTLADLQQKRRVHSSKGRKREAKSAGRSEGLPGLPGLPIPVRVVELFMFLSGQPKGEG